MAAARSVRDAVRSGAGPAATLRRLHRLVPYDAVALSRWDAAAGRHRTVRATGYTAQARSFLDDELHRLPLFAIPLRTADPVRIRDLPRSRRGGPVFERVIRPGGYAEGVTLCLFSDASPRRRVAGMLNLSLHDASALTDEATDLLALLAADLAAVLDEPAPPTTVTAAGAPELTRRELEVLRLVGRGLSNAAVAQALGVAPRTVAPHVEHVLAKLGVPNRAAAVARAATLGLLLPTPP